eukprot:4306009-Amphidinium_carterae.1
MEVLQSDATYKPGMLLAGSKEFQPLLQVGARAQVPVCAVFSNKERERIAAIEVWGCEGPEAVPVLLQSPKESAGDSKSLVSLPLYFYPWPSHDLLLLLAAVLWLSFSQPIAHLCSVQNPPPNTCPLLIYPWPSH